MIGPGVAYQFQPLANGGAQIVASDGTTLLTLSPLGSIVVPSMTTAARDALTSPPAGMLIYNSTTNKLNVRVAAAWEAVTSA